MSLYTLLVMGLRPLGDFPLGALVSALGAPTAVLLSAFSDRSIWERSRISPSTDTFGVIISFGGFVPAELAG